MRIELHLTPNQATVPYNYQRALVGAFHKWLGENELHDDISLYSLSWLKGGKGRSDRKGLEFKHGATMTISSPLSDLHKAAIDGIFKDQMINWGMRVREVRMQTVPEFSNKHRFVAASPILIKRYDTESRTQQYFYPNHPESNTYMTETLKSKMNKIGMDLPISVAFDPNAQWKVKMIDYNGIQIKATPCPVIIEGDPKALQFAWQVGVGNSTGIGFGALV